MMRMTYHAMLPGVLPLLFFAAAATPVSIYGCRGRGLIALAIALVGGIGAVASVV